jgi:hypothetical protein
VSEDVSDKVAWMIHAEASRNRTVKGQDDQVEEETTINRLAKKYPWWFPKASEGHTTEPQVRESELAGVFVGMNTFM